MYKQPKMESEERWHLEIQTQSVVKNGADFLIFKGLRVYTRCRQQSGGEGGEGKVDMT